MGKGVPKILVLAGLKASKTLSESKNLISTHNSGMAKVRIILVVLLFLCAVTVAAKPKTQMRVIVVDGEEICFDETFSADGDGVPPLKRLFGFNVEKRLTGLLRQGYSEKDSLLKTFPSLFHALESLSNEKYVSPENARVTFDADGETMFEYTSEKTGRKADLDKLVRDVVRNVSGAQSVISVSYETLYPETSEKDLRENTLLRGKFSTAFKRSSDARKSNVKLAAKKLNGATVNPGEIFSFNERIGARTVENGFLEAPVIVDGKFQGGVGGGVCQVSTTLYNAVLYADLTVIGVSRHSLPVKYVSASFDAMVSSMTDFKFANDEKYPIYVKSYVKDDELFVEIYGSPLNYEVRLVSEITGSAPRDVKYIDDDTMSVGEELVLVEGADGVISRGILEKYTSGECVFRREIRKDFYKSQQKVVARGTKKPSVENNKENQLAG